MNKGVFSLIPARLKYPQTTYGAFGSRFMHVQDAKAANTNGGTFTAGAWRTRDLNTVLTNEIQGAQLVSNQIILLPGVYQISAKAGAYRVGDHKTRWRNITLGATTLVGTNEHALNPANSSSTWSCIEGRFTIGKLCKFELQHQGTSTIEADGLGRKANLGELEIYAEVMLWKIR